ncbi:MAG: hypothetical protein D4S01_07310 [Dehalococcoidia bacterium]|nr:MAG: hypothetical protein D4S01_07310 [Dehalococcoidia bacterium]
MLYNKLGERGNIIIVLLVSLLVRLLLYLKFYLNPIYSFKSGIPYYYKYDSYYYASMIESMGIPKLVIFIVPILLLCLSLTLFYLSMRKLKISKKYSMLGTLAISLYPNFFAQSLIGYIDTNFIIFLAIAFILYGVANLWENTIKGTIYYFIYFFIGIFLTLLWNGGWFIVFLIMASLCSRYLFMFNRKKFMRIFLVAVPGLFLIKPLLGVLAIKRMGVSEYIPNTYIGYYLGIVFILYYYFIEKNKIEDNDMFFIISIIITTLASLFIQRFASFGIIFIIILVASKININTKKYLIYILCFFLLSSIMISGQHKPTVNDDLANMLEKVEGETIVNFWEYGHIIEYFTHSNITQKANPNPESVEIIKALNMDEKQGVLFLDSLKGNDYYLIIDDHNIGHHEYFESVGMINTSKSNNSIISKTKNNIKLEYYNIISESKLRERSFYLLKRRI